MTRVILTALLALSVAGSALAQNSKVEELRRKARGGKTGAPAHTGHKGTAAAAAVPAAAGAVAETFTIGAEYRGFGGGKKGNLGQATLRTGTVSDSQFEVWLKGDAELESKNKIKKINFDIYRKFEIHGSAVKEIAGTEKFSDDAQKYKKKILSMLALTYLVKHRAPEGQAVTSYTVEGRPYTLKYVPASDRKGGGPRLEGTLVDDTDKRDLAKFFLATDGKPLPFKYFRVYTKDKVSVNFNRV